MNGFVMKALNIFIDSSESNWVPESVNVKWYIHQ